MNIGREGYIGFLDVFLGLASDDFFTVYIAVELLSMKECCKNCDTSSRSVGFSLW